MDHSSNDDFLKAQVQSAPPQKLQLMLIQAAIKRVRLAIAALEREDREAASAPLFRAQDIIGEILGGLRRQHAPDLTKKVAEVYIYLLRHLAAASIDGDVPRLQGIIRVLEEERKTWSEVCAELADAPITATKPAKRDYSSFQMEA